jgi:hypothetical protein
MPFPESIVYGSWSRASRGEHPLTLIREASSCILMAEGFPEPYNDTQPWPAFRTIKMPSVQHGLLVMKTVTRVFSVSHIQLFVSIVLL